MHNAVKSVAALLLFAVAALPALAQTQTKVVIDGPISTLDLTIADLDAMPQAKVRVKIHGKTYQFQGVSFTLLAAKSGAPTGEALKGRALANVVTVHARDNYEIALALAETDPAVSKDRVILATRMNGKPMDDKEGPFRLVVEGDLKPARSAKMVDRITIRPVGAPRPQ